MNPSLCSDVEVLIDKVFDAVVPHKQYRVLTADEYAPCQRTVVHVHELPEGYNTPFSDESYEYKMQAIKACQYPAKNGDEAVGSFVSLAVRLGLAYAITSEIVDFLWPYMAGSYIYEFDKPPVLNMRAFVATYDHMGWPACADYEY